jgi:hypothetical protein
VRASCQGTTSVVPISRLFNLSGAGFSRRQIFIAEFFSSLFSRRQIFIADFFRR